VVHGLKIHLGAPSFAVQGTEALSANELQSRRYLSLESKELKIYLR
jgi:hypothetical protein